MVFASLFVQLALFATLLAAPIGNPSSPAQLEEGFFIPDTSFSNVQIGFTGDYLLQKRMRGCHATKAIKLHDGKIEGTSNNADVVFSVWERFNFLGHVGIGECQWKWKQQDEMIVGQSGSGLVWSGGAKAILLELFDTSLAMDAQAGGWDFMKGHSSLNGAFIPGTNCVKLRFWQVGAAISQRISLLTPYIGCMANQTRFQVTHLQTGSAHFHSQFVLGPFAGCSMSNGSKFFLNLECRGGFEEGVSLSGQIRF
jgi:hypothetical protein